jgi:hypothetical protein
MNSCNPEPILSNGGISINRAEFKKSLDGKEHGEYRWCSFQEALQLLYWKENKEALRRLNKTLTQHSK